MGGKHSERQTRWDESNDSSNPALQTLLGPGTATAATGLKGVSQHHTANALLFLWVSEKKFSGRI